MAHFYILYKIINKINNKFYIGVHKTENIHDDYYGSGHKIKAAIKKYGIENFKKEILQVFTSSKEAFKAEKHIVTEALVKSNQCYNIKEGGRGGFDHIREKGLHTSSKGRKIIHNLVTNQQTKVKPEDLDMYLNNGWALGFHPNALQKMSDSGKIKIQSVDQRKKNSNAKKGCLLMRDPVTGKCKFIKKYLIEQFKKNGWLLLQYGFKRRKSY